MMATHPDEDRVDEVAAVEEPRDHVLRLLHHLHGPYPRPVVDGTGARPTIETAAGTRGDEPEVYHLPHLVVDVAKHMVAAAVAQDPAKLERCEAKAEEAFEYLQR